MIDHPLLTFGATPRVGVESKQHLGVDFAVYSKQAHSVWVVVYNPINMDMKVIVNLSRKRNDIWYGYSEEAAVGDYYLIHCRLNNRFRVSLYYNHRHGLLDPYARKLKRILYQPSKPQLVSEIVAQAQPLSEPKPAIPWSQTVIYEAHVKGLTVLNPDVPEELRGTYLGVCHEAVIQHLKSLGITTLELMPCQAMMDESWLQQKGLTNYWGYNPVCFMAPTSRYAVKDCLTEFKYMVNHLHAAGIEVIVDLVFNHTAEGGLNGSTISLKGIDPATYYLLDQNQKEPFIDYTGCGNALDAANPKVVKLWMDALRVWFNELGVDGFRFDLGVTLGRKGSDFDIHHPFFVALQQDPDLRHAKLIFEPWDLGPNGYQLGRFPSSFAEWNGHFRDNVRKFVRGDGGSLREFTTQFVSDYDQHFTQKPRRYSSINFVTAHDGFTLHDLVSYQDKHNLANQEMNRDGHNDNSSRNYGVEGETSSVSIQQLRTQQKRNFLTILALAKGVPMLLMGDETGRTQQGNNNAYCQDNEISWLSWEVQKDQDLRQFWRFLIDLRRRFDWLYDPLISIKWYRPDGRFMERADWEKWYARSVCCNFIHELGQQVFIIFNMSDDEIEYSLPSVEQDLRLTHCEISCLFDTCRPNPMCRQLVDSSQPYVMAPHAIAAFEVSIN